MSPTDIHCEAVASSMLSTRSRQDVPRRGALEHPAVVWAIAGIALFLTVVAIVYRPSYPTTQTAKIYETHKETRK
jgi:hypothetical protein